MTNVDRALPGAKGEAARPPEWLRGSAVEALTGSAPNAAQLAAMEMAIAGAPPVVSTYRKAGCIVASAALVPCPSIAFGDLADVCQPAESVRDKLTRMAGVLLSGYTAERYATGTAGAYPAELVIVAYMASIIGRKHRDDVFCAMADFRYCMACGIGPNWSIVEAVEIHLRADKPVAALLSGVNISKKNDVSRPNPPHKAALSRIALEVEDRLFDLAWQLSKLGSIRR